MNWSYRIICLCLLCLVLPDSLRAEDKPLKASDIPTNFVGRLNWQFAPAADHTVIVPDSFRLVIDNMEEKDGQIFFAGHDINQSRSKTTIHGKIDLKTRHLTMKESEPADVHPVTEGTLEGTISPDLQTIEAVWTTQSSDKKGTLRLKAENPIDKRKHFHIGPGYPS